MITEEILLRLSDHIVPAVRAFEKAHGIRVASGRITR